MKYYFDRDYNWFKRLPEEEFLKIRKDAIRYREKLEKLMLKSDMGVNPRHPHYKLYLNFGQIIIYCAFIQGTIEKTTKRTLEKASKRIANKTVEKTVKKKTVKTVKKKPVKKIAKKTMKKRTPSEYKKEYHRYFTEKVQHLNDGSEKGVFVCNECGKDYYSKGSATTHYKVKHEFELMSESLKEYKRIEKENKELVEERCLKPWKDPESLFCDTEFLNNLGLNVRKGNDCELST